MSTSVRSKMEEPVLKKQRVRSKNFTLSEVEALKSSVIDHFSVINAKHCDGSSALTKKMQDSALESVSKAVVSVGVAPRTVAEVREKWRNLTKKAKTEVTLQKISAGKTGGGPPAPLPDPILDDIAGLFQKSAAFHGIPGAIDSETFINITTPDIESAAAYITDLPVQATENVSGSTDLHDSSQIGNDTFSQITNDDEVEDPKQASINSMKQPSTTKKSSQKSLKDLQAEYFKIKIENEKRKADLMREQTLVFHQLNKTLPKVNSVLDSMLKKLFSEEE